MEILDKNNLLSPEEREKYYTLLKQYGHPREHFVLEVVEDQSPMDMNDLHYVIIIKTSATHVKSHKSRSYTSRCKRGTWLSEFEEDLQNGYFRE